MYVGSFREYIIDGETGLIVPPRNAEAIEKLLNNENLLNNMKERIAQTKEKEFSWKEAANNLINVYRAIN